MLISSATAYKIFPMEYEGMIFKNIEFSGINKLMLKFKMCVKYNDSRKLRLRKFYLKIRTKF